MFSRANLAESHCYEVKSKLYEHTMNIPLRPTTLSKHLKEKSLHAQNTDITHSYNLRRRHLVKVLK